MGISAYILIEVEPGKVKDVATQLTRLSGVENACVVTGPYDVIGYIRQKNIEELGEMITNNIQTIPGVRKTITCLCSFHYPEEKGS